MSIFIRSQGIVKSYRRIHRTAKALKFNPLVYAPPFKYTNYQLFRIGNRETVGFGINGEPGYVDWAAYPFPSIRYKENTQEILALREREKGDWKLLSLEDKKALYRSSFCQTYAEFQTFRPAAVFEIVGWTLIWISGAIWLFVLTQIYVNPELPDSFLPSSKRAQMRRQIDLQVDPIMGMCSNWDYVKKDWKSKGWFTPRNPFITCSDDFDDQEDDEDD